MQRTLRAGMISGLLGLAAVELLIVCAVLNAAFGPPAGSALSAGTPPGAVNAGAAMVGAAATSAPRIAIVATVPGSQ
jgi:hypothetical protein